MKIIIIGGTSGIGRSVAELLAKQGHSVAITGRRVELLKEIASHYPTIIYNEMDVMNEDVLSILATLIERLGGVDMVLYSSGFGKVNLELNPEIEEITNATNISGFTAIAAYFFTYFRKLKRGHIAVISSVAGVRGLTGAPSYSASKGYQRLYLQSLAQWSHKEKMNIHFSTIIPGFVDTDFIKDHTYPMTISLERATRIIAKGLLSKKRNIYVDWRYRILSHFMRIIPSSIWERML